MGKLIEKWLAFAEADLEAAEILAGSPKSHFSFQLAVLHCHQAIEKILKTIIVSQGKEPKKVHNLIYLLQESGLEAPEKYQKYIEELSPHYQPARYPDVLYKGPILKYDQAGANRHLVLAKEVFKWVKGQLIQKK